MINGTHDEINPPPAWAHLNWRNLPDPEDMEAEGRLQGEFKIIEKWFAHISDLNATTIADGLEVPEVMLQMELTLANWVDQAQDYVSFDEGMSRAEAAEHARYSNMLPYSQHAVHPDHDYDDMPPVVAEVGAISGLTLDEQAELEREWSDDDMDTALKLAAVQAELIRRQEARIKALEAALKPFAEAADDPDIVLTTMTDRLTVFLDNAYRVVVIHNGTPLRPSHLQAAAKTLRGEP